MVTDGETVPLQVTLGWLKTGFPTDSPGHRKSVLVGGLPTGLTLLPTPESRFHWLQRNILPLARGLPFFDFAAAETDRIPPEILENEELMEKLPVLFRTLRGQKVPDEQLDELVRKIRKVSPWPQESLLRSTATKTSDVFVFEMQPAPAEWAE